MFGSKKKEEAMMNEVRHHALIRKAYINELRRKDKKYNFVLVPLFNLGDTRYTYISHNSYNVKETKNRLVSVF